MKMRTRKHQAKPAAPSIPSDSHVRWCGFDPAHGDRSATAPSTAAWFNWPAMILDADAAAKGIVLLHRLINGDSQALRDYRQHQLEELVDEYYRRADDFDRSICTGPAGSGGFRLPANAHELTTIRRHANDVLRDVRERAKALGFTGADLRNAMRAYARSSR